MLAKRIIPCLDVKDNSVVKGIQFKNHTIIGDITDLAQRYEQEGADELVFYDITASSDKRRVDKQWVQKIAHTLSIPFCVAGGIKTTDDAKEILYNGADKISINSPALDNPNLITDIANVFGTQCVVVGIDSHFHDNDYHVYKYTGDPNKTQNTHLKTIHWAKEAQERGAGEIVLNCMNQDGMRQGYDIKQLSLIRAQLTIPLVASGGAGTQEHFRDVFNKAHTDAALAASVFHNKTISIPALKAYLQTQNIRIRP